MKNECLLTTIDNPYNPFDDFASWYMFDCEKGYKTCEYVARITKCNPEMTQNEEDTETERVYDEIIKIDPFDIYKKVYRSDYTSNDRA